MARIHHTVAGAPPRCDLDLERRTIDVLLEAIQQGLVSSAHDCSDGGIAVAIAECVMGDQEHMLGADIDLTCMGRAPSPRCAVWRGTGTHSHIGPQRQRHRRDRAEVRRCGPSDRNCPLGRQRCMHPQRRRDATMFDRTSGAGVSRSTPVYNERQRSTDSCRTTGRGGVVICVASLAFSDHANAAELTHLGPLLAAASRTRVVGDCRHRRYRAGPPGAVHGARLGQWRDAAHRRRSRPTAAIGHTRYSTAGSSIIENAQPVLARYRDGHITLGHNGNLTNASELRRELEDQGSIFSGTRGYRKSSCTASPGPRQSTPEGKLASALLV